MISLFSISDRFYQQIYLKWILSVVTLTDHKLRAYAPRSINVYNMELENINLLMPDYNFTRKFSRFWIAPFAVFTTRLKMDFISIKFISHLTKDEYPARFDKK